MNALPVNEYGCVDMSDGMVPDGTIHITIPYVGRVCKANNIPYAKAFFGCMKIRGTYVPLLLGIAILATDKQRLYEALKKSKSKAIKEFLERESRFKAIAEKILQKFPGMKEKTAEEIAKYAWEEGSDRVGTQLPLDEAIKPAVIAHIRHEYTRYEKILDQFSFYEEEYDFEYDKWYYRKEVSEEDRNRARDQVSGHIAEIFMRWETNSKPALEQVIFQSLTLREKATMAELVFRFSHRKEEDVTRAVKTLLESGKISAVPLEEDPTTVVFVPVVEECRNEDIAA